jgi:hypothetical protein
VLTRFRYLEERAEAARLALRRPGWLMVHDAPAVLNWMRPWVTMQRCGLPEAVWRQARHHRHRLLMPEDLAAWEANRRLLHELGHPLLGVGMAQITQQMTPAERHDFKSAAGAEAYEEWLVDELILALRMPGRLMRQIGDVEQIVRLTRIPWGMVQRRLRTLGDEALHLTWVPYWAAARTLALEYHGGARPCFWVREGDAVRVVVPADAAERGARELRLKADLFALRPTEFLAKYRDFPPPARLERFHSLQPRRLAVEPDELHAWAAERVTTEYGV